MSEGESLEIKRLASLRRLARMSKFNVDNLGVAIAKYQSIFIETT